jgi:hypothetical protein
MALDLLINDNGDVVANSILNGTTDPLTSLAQRLRTRLSTFKGEMYTDSDYGVDYYGVVLTKRYNQQAIDLAFRTEILKEKDVRRIESIDYDYNRSTRTLNISLKVIEQTTNTAVEVVL